MSVARERALTHCCNDLVLRNVVFVEMSVARERALTPSAGDINGFKIRL